MFRRRIARCRCRQCHCRCDQAPGMLRRRRLSPTEHDWDDSVIVHVEVDADPGAPSSIPFLPTSTTMGLQVAHAALAQCRIDGEDECGRDARRGDTVHVLALLGRVMEVQVHDGHRNRPPEADGGSFTMGNDELSLRSPQSPPSCDADANTARLTQPSFARPDTESAVVRGAASPRNTSPKWGIGPESTSGTKTLSYVPLAPIW